MIEEGILFGDSDAWCDRRRIRARKGRMRIV